MAIAVTCNHCGVRLRFKSEHQGRTAKCNACQQSLIVQGDTIPDHDLFISYSSKDKNIADAVCAAMEARRIRCWVAPRDILPGKPWAGAILDAIEDTPIMVLIYSASANASPQVIREVDCAVNRNVIIIPFRIEAAEMSKEMQYYIAAAHWLDAMDGPMDQHIAKLISTVKRLLSDREKPSSPRIQQSTQSLQKKSHTWIIWPTAAILLLAIGTALWFFKHPHAIANVTPVIPTPVTQPASLPSPSTNQSGVVDLLARVRLPDDVMGANWTRSADGLHCEISGDTLGRLKFPYMPPGEYDFSMTFARQSGIRVVGQVMAYGGKKFAWVMGRNFNHYDGFEQVGGAGASQNRSGISVGVALANGKKYTSVVKVRKNSVSAFLDGKLISQLTTDYSDMSLSKLWDMGPDCVGVVTNESLVIYAASITPVSNQLPPVSIASQSPAPTTRPQASPPVARTSSGWICLSSSILLPIVSPARGRWPTAISPPVRPLAHPPIALTSSFRINQPKNMTCAFRSSAVIRMRARVLSAEAAIINSIGPFPPGPTSPHSSRWSRARADASAERGAQWIYPDRRHIALIKVRKDGIEAYIDEKLACEMKTDFKNLSLANGHAQPHRLSLGLEAGPGSAVFQSVQVLEISGKGTPLR